MCQRLTRPPGASAPTLFLCCILFAVMLALLIMGCAAPTAPTSTGPLRIALAGQSNAINLRPFLASQPDIELAGYYGEVQPLACWAASGACWQAWRPTVQPPVEAFVWSQGEYDILLQTPDYGPQTIDYAAGFADLMRRVRVSARQPALLVVAVQKCGAWALHWEQRGITVESDIRAWVQQDGRAVYVETCDLDWRGDGIHMTDAGYRALAERIVARVRARVR